MLMSLASVSVPSTVSDGAGVKVMVRRGVGADMRLTQGWKQDWRGLCGMSAPFPAPLPSSPRRRGPSEPTTVTLGTRRRARGAVRQATGGLPLSCHSASPWHLAAWWRAPLTRPSCHAPVPQSALTQALMSLMLKTLRSRGMLVCAAPLLGGAGRGSTTIASANAPCTLDPTVTHSLQRGHMTWACS